MDETVCYLKPEFLGKKELPIVLIEGAKQGNNGESAGESGPPRKRHKKDKGMNKVSELYS